MMINKESIIKAVEHLRDEALLQETRALNNPSNIHDSTWWGAKINAYNTVLKDIFGVSDDKLK